MHLRLVVILVPINMDQNEESILGVQSFQNDL